VIRSYTKVKPLLALSSRMVFSSIAVLGITDCWNQCVRPYGRTLEGLFALA
jgi:hypothetical protein